MSDALANYRARPGARLFVAPVNEAHPDIARDFDLYRGAEWALGVYDAPEGYRLHRFHEIHAFDDKGNPIGEPELAIDRTSRAWIHLQGKVAPWTDLFSDSEMDRLIRRFWPERDLFELPYL